MAEGFAERDLVSSEEKEELVRLSYDYLDAAVERGLGPKMSYGAEPPAWCSRQSET